MTIERDVLNYLLKIKNKKSLKYKGVRVGLLGLPDFKHYKYQSLANCCSVLKKKEYIREVNGEFLITQKGENFLINNKDSKFRKFSTTKTDSDPKDLLIIYDIPQNQTSIRNWFRRELISFHFIMIQRSVWVGPSPLPKDFIDYVKELKVSDSFKTFKLEKGYDLKK